MHVFFCQIPKIVGLMPGFSTKDRTVFASKQHQCRSYGFLKRTDIFDEDAQVVSKIFIQPVLDGLAVSQPVAEPSISKIGELVIFLAISTGRWAD